MVKKTKSTNLELKKLLIQLKKVANKEKVKIWKAIALELSKPIRKRKGVNLMKIQKFAKDSETIVVPGKVLATGNLTKKVKVAAFKFSEGAREKLKYNAISIHELIKTNPKGKKTRIIK